MAPIRSTRTHFLFFGLALLFSLFQQRLATQLMEKQYLASAEAAWGVLTGYPHWRVFQNRILGPYMVKALSSATGDFLLAYFVFGIVMLAIAGYLAWYLGCRLRNATFGLLAFFAFQAAFSLVLDKYWLYAWDYIDLVVFFLFAVFVLAGKRWPWFVALFLVALVNRESAQFIALWLILDPLVRRLLATRAGAGAKTDWPRLAAGVACLLFSIVAIEALRQALLIEEVGFKLFGYVPSIEFGPNFQLKFFVNLDLIRGAALEPGNLRQSVPVLLFVGFASVAVLAAMRLSGIFVSLAVLQLGMLAAILLVAHMRELRIYFQMIPLFVLCVTALAVHHDGQKLERPEA